MCTHAEKLLVKGGEPVCCKDRYEQGILRASDEERREDDFSSKVIHLRGTYVIGGGDAS